MSDVPRLNGAIKALEAGAPAFVSFAPAEVSTAIALSAAPYDAVIFEMEHGPYDARALRDCMQYMLDRRAIVETGSVAPRVTPFARIPPNGGEANQWIAKQALDGGVYGIVWPHVSTVDAARNAVASCRYPRPRGARYFEPAGLRGDGPAMAARYWGLTSAEYYARADVWPLDPAGEILVVIMCEDLDAIKNLPAILEKVPGIGVVLIGEGDLSQDLGFPRQYTHPAVASAIRDVLAICQDHGVPCGHPHVNETNVEGILAAGFRWLVAAPTLSFAAAERGRSLSSGKSAHPIGAP